MCLVDLIPRPKGRGYLPRNAGSPLKRAEDLLGKQLSLLTSHFCPALRMGLWRDADLAEVEDHVAVGVDLWAEKLDRVGRADAKFGHQTIGSDDLGAASAVISGRIGVPCARNRRFEREPPCKPVKHYQITRRFAETFVRNAAEHDGTAAIKRHIQPRPMRSHIAPRQYHPITIRNIVVSFHEREVS